MNIEMPEDLAEDIANQLHIYGRCEECCDRWGDRLVGPCRQCFVSALKERIIKSVRNMDRWGGWYKIKEKDK